jgi:carbohydrate-selective porin OprB
LEIVKSITLTPNLQLVFDPASNAGDDVVVVPGIRLLMKF